MGTVTIQFWCHPSAARFDPENRFVDWWCTNCGRYFSGMLFKHCRYHWNASEDYYPVNRGKYDEDRYTRHFG